MRTIRNLIGIPVICDGRKIGRLLQAELSADLTRLEGVWVDGGFRGTRYISADRLSMIGEMAVFADDFGRRGRINIRPLLRRAVTTDGRRAGAIVGAEIDEMTFLVGALEMTAGFWNDLFSRRRRVERFSARSDAGEVLILEPAQNFKSEAEACPRV